MATVREAGQTMSSAGGLIKAAGFSLPALTSPSRSPSAGFYAAGLRQQAGKDNDERRGMMPDATPCPEQQRLAEKVQRHLIGIAELSHAAADAVANGNDNLLRELDKLLENSLGEKERALGALRQHREEHGC